MTESLTRAQVAASDGVDDWRVIHRTIQTSFRTGSMAAGIDFVTRIGPLADAANHHPDLTGTYPRGHVLLTAHDTGGLTTRDVDLARQISAVAAELGIEADPGAPAEVEIAIDAMDIPRVKAFWEAVLGYRPDSEHDSADPHSRGPGVWFQQMETPRTERNNLHVDVAVPHDVAEGRLPAALAAGGTLLSDDAAPAFWVLADPEGNEVCICTWQARD